MNSIPCDIVLLPESQLTDKAITLSKQLEPQGTLFTLSKDTCIPHASLYMTQLKVTDLDRVQKLLSQIASRTPTVKLVSTRYDQAEGYIDADYERTDELVQLQMTVIEAINPIRDGMREKDKARLSEATGQVRENLEEYGYRGVGELFRPHLSFTRFVDGQAVDTDSLPEPSHFSGRFDRLAICEMGDNGTCARLIAELELQG